MFARKVGLHIAINIGKSILIARTCTERINICDRCHYKEKQQCVTQWQWPSWKHMSNTRKHTWHKGKRATAKRALWRPRAKKAVLANQRKEHPKIVSLGVVWNYGLGLLNKLNNW